jgi:FkbM family methyltransferase
MSALRHWLRNFLPHGLVERHRRRFRLGSIGLKQSPGIEDAVQACRYDLWPTFLRSSTEPWALVDVGANEGEFTAAAARLANLSAVHAFEPQPSCHAKLSKVLATTPHGELHPCALGAARSQMKLNCTANSRMTSLLMPNQAMEAFYEQGSFQISQSLDVHVMRLDDVLPPNLQIGLLKIDVQGYEMPVLEGAKKTLLRTQALLLEANYVPHYADGSTFDAMHAWMTAHGFRTHAISAPFMGPEGPLWADVIFVKD